MMENFDLDANFTSFFEDEEVTVKVVNNLNKIFGRDLKNLHKAKDRVEELQLTLKELEQRLLFATNEAPDKISRAINTAEEALAKNEEIEKQIEILNKEISDLKQRKKLMLVLEEISPNLKIIQEAEKVKAYQKWLADIQNLSSQIESSLKLGHEEQALTHYGKMKDSAETIINSQCSNLKDYTFQMVLHWHKILLSRLENEFQSVLKALKWPFVLSGPSLKPPTPSPELIQRLKIVIEQLLQLNVSEAIRCGVKTKKSDKDEQLEEKVLPSLVSIFSVSSVPLQLLLKPLEIRFLYHFSSEKATNSRRNPEWYLTQVLKWITAHESFIETYIQPVLNKIDHARVNAKVEFMKGLLRLVVLKLSSDFPEIQEDEDLFCQTVQETLNFERELRLGLSYPSSQPTVLSVLTQASVFSTWISIERKFALELMDEFVASANAWQSEEEGGICQCGEQLILLLQGITDRYKPLSQPGHRLQFLDLQLELLDDFRVRILQLTKSELLDPLQSNYISILNTVHYLVSTISDWADLPFYIEMQYFKEKFSSVEDHMKSPLSNYVKKKTTTEPVKSRIGEETKDESNSSSQNKKLSPTAQQQFEVSESVFKNILNLYSRIECEMLSVVNKHVLTEVRARSQSYRRDKWFFSPSESFYATDSSIIPEVSPSLCPLLGALVKHLLLLRQNLAPQLFSRFWKELTAALNKFIYEEVILQNTFSEYGAAQLNHDMTKALFPIFGEFTSKPENFFPLVKESLILLTLPRPTAFLLKDTLQQAISGRDFYSQNVSPVKALEERGVLELDVHEAQIIFNIRTNMTAL